jgi:regulatory protein
MDLFEKYYNYSLKFLSYRPRSEKEVVDALVKKKAPKEVVAKVISYLKELRFINDDEFARWWVDQRTSYRQRSKYVIGMELRQKGIAQDLIEKYVTENAETAVNDLEQAKILAVKKIDRYRKYERQELYVKLGGVLARKGFSWYVIKRAIDFALSDSS